jgi:hypothetical protein
MTLGLSSPKPEERMIRKSAGGTATGRDMKILQKTLAKLFFGYYISPAPRVTLQRAPDFLVG